MLCIGDAAHAMSPVGGVGVNLAIQDAVAAANVLVPSMRRGKASEADLRAIQKRRDFPTRATQRVQVLIQDRVITSVLRGKEVRGAKVWVASHFSLAPIRRHRLSASCAADSQSFRAKPSRA